MPVEIREIIIKTEISVTGRSNLHDAGEREWKAWKKQLLEECRKMIAGNRKTPHKR